MSSTTDAAIDQQNTIQDLSAELELAYGKITLLEKDLALAQTKIEALENAATAEATPAAANEYTFKQGKNKFKLLYPTFIIGSITYLAKDVVNDTELQAIIVKDYPSLCEAQ